MILMNFMKKYYHEYMKKHDLVSDTNNKEWDNNLKNKHSL